MLIAQISDLHVAEADNYMRKFVDANAKLAAAVDYLNAMQLRPDVVLATGDLTDHGRPEQYELLAAILAELDIPLLLIPGNHDEREPFLEAFAATHPYLPRQGPIQYVIDDYDVRLIAVDTTRVDHHDGAARRRAPRSGSIARSRNDRTTRRSCSCTTRRSPPASGGWTASVSAARASSSPSCAATRMCELVLAGHLHRPITTNWGSHCGVDRAQHDAPSRMQPASRTRAGDGGRAADAATALVDRRRVRLAHDGLRTDPPLASRSPASSPIGRRRRRA